MTAEPPVEVLLIEVNALTEPSAFTPVYASAVEPFATATVEPEPLDAVPPVAYVVAVEFLIGTSTLVNV
jgi:hypothetical protein